MENILTTDQVLFQGKILIKLEGTQTDVIRVHDIQILHGLIYLKIEDQESGRVHTIIYRIGFNFHLWRLISYDYLVDKFLFKNNKWTEIEFDF